MYPTLVVVLIATRRNYLEQSIEGASIADSHPTREMYFAPHKHDSEYGSPGRRSTVQSLRTDSIASSKESIIPLNISFGPAFDPDMDLFDPHLAGKYDGGRGNRLLAIQYPSGVSSSSPDNDTPMFEKAIITGEIEQPCTLQV